MTDQTQVIYPALEELEAQGKKLVGIFVNAYSLPDAQNLLSYAKRLIHQGKPQFHNPLIVRVGDEYKVFHEEIEQEPWNPTGKPDLDRTINFFCSTTRSSDHETKIYDGRCSGEWKSVDVHLHESFKYIEGWEDASYRAVWLSEELMAAVTYCEGDVTVEVADDAEGYEQIVRTARQSYMIDKDHWVVILDSLPVTQAIIDLMSQEWKQTKLKAYNEGVIARGNSSDQLWEVARSWLEANPDEYLKIERCGGALAFGKKELDLPEARDEFDRYFDKPQV